MKRNFLMPMNLQFFAEQTDPPADPSQNSTDGADDKPKPDEPKPEEKKYSDADLDKIINQKFAKWQKDSEEKLRQSQLSAEEKEKERITKLEKLERDVATRDAKDVARKALSEAKLPSEFADFVYDTQEDVAKEKMENFTKLLANYRESVVTEVLKDKTPDKPRVTQQTELSWRDKARQNYQKVKESE
ncbi:DUF4355 domain-containing protein [Enterococcus saccharolyticus]|uniref:DUF4355 domain-containing protein n=1 Tax=Enterococcus saccharolyticus TaxID=41997 RepID=UPI001E350841|nr:DUF4355 domain-containing protein [Enterococcus saccharolyticus]MCD5001188.1 DUF4355 domain-containing protein [Enterococcus saccharolyticus]